MTDSDSIEALTWSMGLSSLDVSSCLQTRWISASESNQLFVSERGIPELTPLEMGVAIVVSRTVLYSTRRRFSNTRAGVVGMDSSWLAGTLVVGSGRGLGVHISLRGLGSNVGVERIL